MLRGLVKKVLLADRLGEAVDVVFAGPDLYSGVTIWIVGARLRRADLLRLFRLQ